RRMFPRGKRRWDRLARSYYRCSLSFAEAGELVALDDAAAGAVRDTERPAGRRRSAAPVEPDQQRRAIYKLWPDFRVRALVDRSVATVKADAALRAYEATGEGIVWAVLDSGVEASHPHFGSASAPENHVLLDPSVAELHRDFTLPGGAEPGESMASALTDGFGHGTHVAGIISGGLPHDYDPRDVAVFEHSWVSGAGDPPSDAHRQLLERRVVRPHSLRGVAPGCRLVSLRVLDDNGQGRTSDIIRALQYLLDEVNGDPRLLRVHGVNLSVGYEFDAELFACGQSPLCVEVDRVVRSGVVAVVAAGNTGYVRINAMERQTKVALSSTINDPGNSDLAIT